MVFEMREHEVVDCAKPYRLNRDSKLKYKVRMAAELLEEVTKFKYLG